MANVVVDAAKKVLGTTTGKVVVGLGAVAGLGAAGEWVAEKVEEHTDPDSAIHKAAASVETHLGAVKSDVTETVKGEVKGVEIGAMMPSIFMKMLVFLMAKMFGGDMMKKFLSPEQAKVLGLDLNDFKEADAKNGEILGQKTTGANQTADYNATYLKNLEGHTLADGKRSQAEVHNSDTPPASSANSEPQGRLGSRPAPRDALPIGPVSQEAPVETTSNLRVMPTSFEPQTANRGDFGGLRQATADAKEPVVITTASSKPQVQKPAAYRPPPGISA